MAATKWKCSKCGKTCSTNGPKPFSAGCLKSGTFMHNWVKDRFSGLYWDRILGK